MSLIQEFESPPHWPINTEEKFLESRRHAMEIAEESLVNSRNAMKNYAQFVHNDFPAEPGWNSEETENKKPDSP